MTTESEIFEKYIGSPLYYCADCDLELTYISEHNSDHSISESKIFNEKALKQAIHEAFEAGQKEAGLAGIEAWTKELKHQTASAIFEELDSKLLKRVLSELEIDESEIKQYEKSLKEDEKNEHYRKMLAAHYASKLAYKTVLNEYIALKKKHGVEK